MTLHFRDSFRIFPISLKNLCKNFEVEGKFSDYNIEFNNITLLDKPKFLEQFKEYSLQDSLSLYKALFKAQEIYHSKYNIDITTAYSTSNLSLKIFRTHFLKDKEILILKHSEDEFVRESYFGGATDYYKVYGRNLHYYYINSLYPYVMTFPMPHKLEKIVAGSLIDINSFFGFIKCEVECPEDMLKPMLPVKYKNQTIFTTCK